MLTILMIQKTFDKFFRYMPDYLKLCSLFSVSLSRSIGGAMRASTLSDEQTEINKENYHEFGGMQCCPSTTPGSIVSCEILNSCLVFPGRKIEPKDRGFQTR
jgi:hypothetical protein